MKTKIINRKAVILYGIFFGLFMFMLTDILIPVSSNEKLTLLHLLVKLVIWIAGGLLIGWLVELTKASKSKDSK